MDQQRKLDLLPSPENGHLHLLSEIQRERSASQDFMNEAEQLEKNYRSSASNLASVKAEIAELTGQNLSDLESARRHEPEPELAGGVVAMEQSPLPTDIGRSNDARSPVVARGAVRGTRQGRRHQEGEDDGTASSPPSAASTKRRGKVGRRLMVRTYTDILREQAKHTSYWEPPAGILIDHTEEPSDVVSTSRRFPFGSSHRQGLRPSQQDRSVICGCLAGRPDTDYFAIFDGHGSRAEADFAAWYMHRCAAYELLDLAASNIRPSDVLSLLERVFQQTSDAMRAHGYGVQSGTTAVVCLLLQNVLYVANAGDTNAVLYTAAGTTERLTYEHKPSDPAERARVEAIDGGIVTTHRGGPERVQGSLSVSRALGDFWLVPYVISNPAVRAVELDLAGASGLILACDGVWDVLSEQEAAKIVLRWPDNPQGAADALVDASLSAGSQDNISVIIVTGLDQISKRPMGDAQVASNSSMSRGSRPQAVRW